MRQGDIVMVEFPFSNMAEKKLRPAVVVSNDSYNRFANVLLAGLYSRRQPLSVSVTNRDTQKKRLRKGSFISLQNLVSAEKSLIKYTVDALTAHKLKEIISAVNKCF